MRLCAVKFSKFAYDRTPDAPICLDLSQYTFVRYSHLFVYVYGLYLAIADFLHRFFS